MSRSPNSEARLAPLRARLEHLEARKIWTQWTAAGDRELSAWTLPSGESWLFTIELDGSWIGYRIGAFSTVPDAVLDIGRERPDPVDGQAVARMDEAVEALIEFCKNQPSRLERIATACFAAGGPAGAAIDNARILLAELARPGGLDNG